MHDLHEANKILNLILANAQISKLNKVTRAKISLGKIIEHGADISPENLKFNIALLAQNTIASGLSIEIKVIKGDLWKLESIEGETI